jgi:zinc protease
VVTVLPNGLKLIVQPEAVSDSVMVYGEIKNRPSLQEPRGQEGVSQVLEQLFPYGTGTMDRLALEKAWDDIGAEVNTGTSFAVKVLADNFERGVQLLADNELHPALPEKDFHIVQSQVAGMVAGELQSPDFLAGQSLKAALFPENDPTLRHPTPPSVQSLTLKNVKDYFQSVFRPDKTIIVVIGKVTPERALAAIKAAFGPWEAAGPPPDTLLPPVPLNKPAMISVPDASRVQDKVVLAQNLGINRSNPDYYALNLGNHVLGGGFYATRLYQDLREKTGLVYHIEVDMEADRTRALYNVDYGCEPANVPKARGLVVSNLEAMINQPVKPEELLQAKSMLLNEITLAESSQEDIARGLLKRAVLDLPLEEPTIAAKHYLELDADRIQAAFAKWVRPANLVELIQGPAAK